MKKLAFICSLLLCVQHISANDNLTPNLYVDYFEEAYHLNPGIPKGMLEAVSHTTTRFYHLDGANSESCMGLPKYYGVMGLVLDGKGVFDANLTQVSLMSGYPEVELIESPRINILGYAAAFSVLSRRHQINSNKPEDFLSVLTELSELGGKNIKNDFGLNSFLYSVFKFLGDSQYQQYYEIPEYKIDMIGLFGVNNLRIHGSSEIVVDNEAVKSIDGVVYEAKSALGGACNDYGPASWVEAGCFSSRNGTTISAVTVHTMEGYYSSTITWFQNCEGNNSAHYLIRSSDGQVTQMVCEADKAWHVSNDNPYTIGIEHEGFVSNSAWYTTAMYNSSADLVQDITDDYGINPLRTYSGPSTSGVQVLGGCIKVKGHHHFPSNPNSHTDPGINWDWPRYYELINENPNTTTYTANDGSFCDSGGSSGNYSDDERRVYVISPGSGPFELDFTSFNLESNWDYMWIYDGNTSNGSEVSGSPFTGTNSPGTVQSSSGSLYVEFRSDCATTASGWCASWDVGSGGGDEDITVSNASVSPTAVAAGGTVDAEADQYYSGNSNTVPDVYLHYYLSTDCSFGGGDVLLDDEDWSSIDAGDSYDTESEILTIPAGTAPGTYYILFIGDATNVVSESNENNNIDCVQITVGNPTVEDITISNASVSPATVIAGGTVDAEADQNYSGSSNSVPDVYLHYYLSTDCSLGGGDILLDDEDWSSIDAGDLYDTESEILTIPAGTAPGTYFILFVADATNVVSESNENNNVECVQITIPVVETEDISLTNNSVVPTTIPVGGSFEMEVDQVYAGFQLDADLPSFDLEYYISTDCNLDVNDLYLDDDFSGLGSDDPVNTESLLWAIPGSVVPGTYYILFVGDSDDELTESNEGNNIVCTQITVVQGTPEGDIYSENESVTPSIGLPDENVTVMADHVYTGGMLENDMPSFSLMYFLSEDCAFGPGDVELEVDLSSLGSDEPIENETEVVTIPAGTPYGSYYILFISDGTDLHYETNENNNLGCVQFTVGDVTVSIEEETVRDFQVMPNPNFGQFQISVPEVTQEMAYQVYDNLGQVVFNGRIQSYNTQVNMEPYSQGIYTVKVLDESGIFGFERVVILD